MAGDSSEDGSSTPTHKEVVVKTLALLLSSVLFVSVAFLAVDNIRSASACPSTNSAQLLLMSGGPYVQPDGTFQFIHLASWKTKGKPFIGSIRKATGTIGVTDLSYVPQYWFPSGCEGGLSVLVSGRKSGLAPHAVNTVLQVGPAPNDARTVMPVEIP
jgi:hypothetical protein